MPAQRIELQPAYILHTRPYRDTSLLIDAITQDYGKVSLIAKGARKVSKTKTSQRSFLQPFISLRLSWQGKSTLKTLINAEVEENHNKNLLGQRLYSAMYINELLLYLLPQENPTDEVYDQYQQLLNDLSDKLIALEPCLRQFEFQLLNELGYGINFFTDADTGDVIDKSKPYLFILNHGFVEMYSSNTDSLFFMGKDLLNIQSGIYDIDTCRTAKIIARLALKPHLKNKVLKSRELFKVYQ